LNSPQIAYCFQLAAASRENTQNPTTHLLSSGNAHGRQSKDVSSNSMDLDKKLESPPWAAQLGKVGWLA
jgi:hypothetical protein